MNPIDDYRKTTNSRTKTEIFVKLLTELGYNFKSSNDYIHIQIRDIPEIKIDIWPTTCKMFITLGKGDANKKTFTHINSIYKELLKYRPINDV